jgi:hypothetical protein
MIFKKNFDDDATYMVSLLLSISCIISIIAMLFFNFKYWDVKEICVNKSIGGNSIEKICRDTVIIR